MFDLDLVYISIESMTYKFLFFPINFPSVQNISCFASYHNYGKPIVSDGQSNFDFKKHQNAKDLCTGITLPYFFQSPLKNVGCMTYEV